MTEELVVSNPQFVSAFADIDSIRDKIISTGELSFGYDAINSIRQMQHLVGWSMAKFLYMMKDVCKQLGFSDDTFIITMEENTFLSAKTINRYIDAWNAFLYAKQERLLEHPINNAIELGKAIAQGIELTEDNINLLMDTVDTAQFSQTLRSIKGVEPRSNSLRLYIAEDGSINGWFGDETFFVGYLNVEERTKIPGLDKAITRIVNNSHIMKEGGR